MRVWKVLGKKNGNLDRQTQGLLALTVLPVLIFTENILYCCGVLLLEISFSYIVKKNFDGRDDWLLILYRLLFRQRGSFNMVDRDRGGR